MVDRRGVIAQIVSKIRPAARQPFQKALLCQRREAGPAIQGLTGAIILLEFHLQGVPPGLQRTAFESFAGLG
jgi:hypothetical protein